VRVQYVGRARMDGKDMPMLLASFTQKGDRMKRFNPGQIATGVMVASADKKFNVPRDTHEEDAVEFTPSATALQSTKAVTTSFDLMQDFVQLPELGPVPRERPSQLGENNILLSAYAADRIDTASEPFEYVLADGNKLDADSIRASVKKRQPGLF
jgi:rare lipoprotein A